MIEFQNINPKEGGLSVRGKINSSFASLINGKEGVNALWEEFNSLLRNFGLLKDTNVEQYNVLSQQVTNGIKFTEDSVNDLLVYINGMNGGISGFAIDPSFVPEFPEDKSATVLAAGPGTYTNMLDENGDPITITETDAITIFYKGANSTYWQYKSIYARTFTELVKRVDVKYFDKSTTDGDSRTNSYVTFRFLDANDNLLFMATLLGADDNYPGLLNLKNKHKLNHYADTFKANPVASADNNGLMSSLDKEKLDHYADTFESNPLADSGNVSGNPKRGLMGPNDKKKLENYSLYFQDNATATETDAGLMSADDKSKLDSVDEVIDLPWNDDAQGEDGYINNFTERGEYHIHGERLYADDGLPILNAASGHTIDGRMTVLDSSLPNGNKYDVCVTQILRLNNRVGGDGHIFIRTGIAATKAELQRSDASGWSTWEKLMGVFEKNMVSSASDLDKYISSGMYDGMFVFSSASQTIGGLKIESGSTFLMVVVNGYAVASAGVVPQVTQLLYLMPSGLDGSSGVRNAEVYTRTGIYVASTKTYTWGKFDGLAHASDIAKIYADLQETDNLAQENQSAITALGKITSTLQGSVRSIEEHGLSDVNFTQEEDGSLSIEKLGLDSRKTKSEFPLATTTAAGAMSAADKIKLENYSLYFKDNATATDTQAGLMSADDKAEFEKLKVEFEKVKNSIGANIYGCVRVSGVSDPQLTFRRYIADGAAGNPLDVIHPCLVEKGTGRLLHILQNLNFEKDINGAPRKIDGSEGEVYITNTEPIYHITGHVYVNGVSYDVFLRSLYPFTWQGKEAEVIEPFGLSPDNCVAHRDDDGVTRMHSVYNPEWAGSYYAMNGFVGKFVYEGIGNAMTDTYDASGALFDGAGGLASVSINLYTGEQYAMNMNEDTTKTVPFFNEHAYALELFIGHMYAEGGTYDAHNAALMGSGFTANDNVTNAAHFNADNEPAVNGARYLGGDGNTTRHVGNGSYGQWYASGTKKYLPEMLTNWSSPWKIMERQRVMAYAIENNIPELTWFAFEGNKYKWRSVSGFAGPNDGVMTCVVFKVFSTQFAADMVDPTGGASLEGHRIDFMITGAIYRGWSTDVSPSRWDSGLIFTTDNTALYKAYIQRDQSKMVKSVNADANADTVLPFEESYEYIGSVQGIQRNYRRDFSDGSLFHAKSSEQLKGGNLHTHIGAYNWYDSQSSAAGIRSVRGFRRGSYAGSAALSPCTVYAAYAPSVPNTALGFGTCVRIAKET